MMDRDPTINCDQNESNVFKNFDYFHTIHKSSKNMRNEIHHYQQYNRSSLIDNHNCIHHRHQPLTSKLSFLSSSSLTTNIKVVFTKNSFLCFLFLWLISQQKNKFSTSKQWSNIFKTSLLIILQINQCLLVDCLELRANCGYPGKPYRSKIIPEEKLIYEEGETVSFQCQDYWAPPQMRKCVNGVWVGPPARCGDFVLDVLMNDAKLLDMSFGLPIEKFHYRNMNLSTTDWKYPNAFTSNRYSEHRLRIANDHEYMWKFNFTRPAVKLFVKVNFNFINFTLLDQAIKNNFSFYIDVEISPYRTCNLDYQSNNAWKDNGNRIDSYFTCEAHSYQDLTKDIEMPSNYMIMRTKSSHNLPHELVALFFGHVYGNETEPLCGEPETDYGQSYRANQENKDYIIDCLNGQWKDVTPNAMKYFVYNQKCIGDMIWNGTRPRCVPIRNCPIQKILNNNRRTKNETEKNPLVVDAVLRYYNFIDNQTIYAIVGTEIVYACASVDYILVGKDTRTCKRDMTWSGTEPVCKYIKPTSEVVESPNYLIVIIVCMGVLLFLILIASCLLFLFCTKHLHITKKNESKNTAGECLDAGPGGHISLNDWQSENYYDNIEMNFNANQTGSNAGAGKNDVFYDIYETVDSNKDNHLARYTEPNQYHHHHQAHHNHNHHFYGEQTAIINNKENDYIRMFGAIKVDSNPITSSQAIATTHQSSIKDTSSPGVLPTSGPVTQMPNPASVNSSNMTSGQNTGVMVPIRKTKTREPSYLEVMQ